MCRTPDDVDDVNFGRQSKRREHRIPRDEPYFPHGLQEMSAPAQRRIATRVGELALVDEGEGRPVVLWPSLFSDHRLFTHVCAALGEGWRTLRLDGPGFGRSEPPRGEVQADVYADAVLDVLDALGLARVLVAGCSWGGQVAAHLGVRAPARVRGVLMMNTPLGPSLGGHAFERFGTRLFGHTRFWGDGVARSMFSLSTQAAHPERVAAFVAAFPGFDRAASAETVRTVMTRSPGLAEVLPQLTVPTTILMGAEDRLYPVARLAPFVELVPGAVREIVPGCGHLAPIEAPGAVAAALRGLAARAAEAEARRVARGED
jgi:pimeloyl-ACP methyl ester carboxylesterase